MFVKENSIRVSCYITQIGLLVGNPTREEGKERPHSNKAAAKRVDGLRPGMTAIVVK